MPDDELEQPDTSDPGSEGPAGDAVSAQLSQQDMLEDRGVDDLLDEGYSPPDRAPAADVPTLTEERDGETLDQRLSEEEPDVAPSDAEVQDRDEVGDRRSGRLTDAAGDGVHDREKDLIAADVGVDGAAAAAEEAAVHVVDQDAEQGAGQDDEPSHPDGTIVDQ